MRNIKLVLEYDGSTFFGFQKQPGKPTVQEVLEKALSGFFDRKMKIAAASGRTDTGVHATGQVVHLDLAKAWPPRVVTSPLPPPTAIELPVSRSVPDPEAIRVAVPETFPAKVSDVAGFTTSIAAPPVPEVENPRLVVAVAPV
jgi:tRNA pseudouridine(38-40) synthase